MRNFGDNLPEPFAGEYYREKNTVGPVIGPQTHSGRDRTLPWQDSLPSSRTPFDELETLPIGNYSEKINPQRLSNTSSSIQNPVPGQRWTTRDIFSDELGNDLQQYVSFPEGDTSTNNLEQSVIVLESDSEFIDYNQYNRNDFPKVFGTNSFIDSPEELNRVAFSMREQVPYLESPVYQTNPFEQPTPTTINANTPSKEISSFSGFVS